MSILTPSLKNLIDKMIYEDMLRRWRFAPVGDPMFESESGKYFSERMAELRAAGADHVGASKRIGWEK